MDADIDDLDMATDQGVSRDMMAYEYWSSLLADRPFPSITDLSAERLADFKSFSFLVSLPKEGPDGAVIRFAGHQIEETAGGIHGLIGLKVPLLPSSCLIRRVASLFAEVAEKRVPQSFELARLIDEEDSYSAQGMLFPFGDGGERAKFVWGVVSDLDNGKPSEDHEDHLEEMVESGPQNPVQARLAESQAAAGGITHVDQRSRTALYEVLAKALAVYEESLIDPDSYNRLLDAKSIHVQERAPFTPVIKLVFGKNYDKTRITEYAATLSYARRCGQGPEDFVEFISAQPGGIKGCVKAERIAKRQEKGIVADLVLEAAKETLRQQKPLGTVALPKEYSADDDEEFLLLVARKSAKNGKIEVLRVLDEKQGFKDPMIKRAAKALEEGADTADGE